MVYTNWNLVIYEIDCFDILYLCVRYTEHMLRQGHDWAPGLDIMLLKQLAECIANNYSEKLNVPPRPDPSKPWSTATLNRILQTCIVSDSRGINIPTFETVEFESDLYRGVMCAQCYPFNMERHRFRGRNVKVCTYTWYMYCILHVYVQNILCIYMYWADHALCWIVWQLSLLIHSTLESLTTTMTLLNHYLIKTMWFVRPQLFFHYAASHRYCCGPLQPFRRGHSARLGFFQPLWGNFA